MSKREQQATADPFAEMLGDLWAALAGGDVLRAEIELARCCAVPSQLGADQDRSDAIFVGMARQGGRPEDAALLRLIMQMGSPAVRKQAREALGELTSSGVYPASWVTEMGKAEPVRASRVFDMFGDWEDLYVTYRYAAGEHTLIARIALFDLPTVRALELAEFAPGPAASGSFEVVEEISLADARARLEPALSRSESSFSALQPESRALLPVARSRVRRLPASAGTGSSRRYTAEDRAALVREFMSSRHAAEAVAADEAATRWWAEILIAWSSRVPGHPPLQAGPLTVRAILEEHVPCTYPVTRAQFRQMPAAVTAWARWSAAQRGLDEEHMVSKLPQALSFVQSFYAEPIAVRRRAHVADVVTADIDVVALRQVLDARAIAIPVPEIGDEEDDVPAGLDDLDMTEVDDRAAYLADEFGDCEGGPAGDRLLGAVLQVAEELWHGRPESTRDRALALLAEDELDRHDIMHRLAEEALSRTA